MKKYFSLIAVLLMLIAVPAFAANLGYSVSDSQYDQATSNVVTGTDSFHAVGVLGSGYANGSNYAGGQAVTTHSVVVPIGVDGVNHLRLWRGTADE